MKVLHIISGLATGGAEQALYSLLKGGLARCSDNCVVSLGDEGSFGSKIKALQVSVHALDMQSGSQLPGALNKLYGLTKDLQPDVIQGWMYHGNMVATLVRAVAGRGAALVWGVRHGLYDLRAEKRITRLVIRTNQIFSRQADALLYNSSLSRMQHEALGFHAHNARVIANGIDMQRYRFCDEARKRVRLELKIPGEAYLISHIARLHPLKDHPTFLRAATALAKRFPSIHFLLGGRDVLSQNTLLTRFIPQSIMHRFHFLGERGDVPDLLSATDIFCLSSYSEAFPNVLCEAMAVGVPCVATDVGDVTTILGDTGVLICPRNESALCAAVEKLIEMSSGELRQLGTQARRRIETNYRIDVIVNRYAAMYDKLCVRE